MKKPFISIFLLVAYCAILIKVMVFKDMPTIHIGSLMLNFSGTESGHPPNFVPFKTILPYLLGYKGFIIASINLIGNIVLLVPIGFLVPFVFPNINGKRSLVLAVASGLSIEVMQVVLHVGIFDIDDIILNALGVMIGYWAFLLLAKWLRNKNYTSIVLAAIIVVAAIAIVFYFIYPKGNQLINPSNNASGVRPDSVNDKEAEISQNVNDPCRGTGGTGQIISVGNNLMSIKLNNGVIKNIKLTDQTKIRTTAGLISQADLQAGERVTLVIDSDETASLVLVCTVVHPTTRPDH